MGIVGADGVVDHSGELPARRLRRGRNRDHDRLRVPFPQRLYRGEHARTGRQAVVDEDHRLAGHLQRRSATPVDGLAPDQFPPFTFGDVTQLLGCDAQRPQHVVVDDDMPTAGQRAHRELFVAGRAQLAHDERIQRDTERRRHLPGHGNPTAGQPQHHNVLATPVGAEQFGQDPARFAAVTEHPAGRVA